MTAALAIVGVLVAIYLDGEKSRLGWLAAGAMTIAIVSYIDDCINLSAALRFGVHLMVAAAMVFGGFVLIHFDLPGLSWQLSGTVAAVVSIFFIVWMINLYNFMDGMDGFAGGMTLIGFSALALVGFMAGDELYFAVNATIAAVAAGFLLFNFPPARIFMGDVGSSTFGLLAAGISLWGVGEGMFPFWAALLLFSPFVVDASVTLCRRLFRGEKVWQAHRTHYYQRLVQLGWGHRRTVLSEYVLMLGCAGSMLWVLSAAIVVQWGVIAAWILGYVVFAGGVKRMEATRLANNSR